MRLLRTEKDKARRKVMDRFGLSIFNVRLLRLSADFKKFH